LGHDPRRRLARRADLPEAVMEIRIKRGDEQYGPYSLADVRTYLGEGRLAPHDLASTDGESWRPLDELLAHLDGRGPAPASVGGPYRPAGLGARLGAAILDLLVACAFLIPGMLVGAARFDVGVGDREILIIAVSGFAAVAYQFVKDGFGGRSLGKRATGLMVVHLPTNRPCSILRSAVRTLVIFLTNVLLGVGWVIEPVLVIATPDRRRLGDRAASTQVIRMADYQA
jgi:uncharacterized RDD family membrane protein YckC